MCSASLLGVDLNTNFLVRVSFEMVCGSSDCSSIVSLMIYAFVSGSGNKLKLWSTVITEWLFLKFYISLTLIMSLEIRIASKLFLKIILESFLAFLRAFSDIYALIMYSDMIWFLQNWFYLLCHYLVNENSHFFIKRKIEKNIFFWTIWKFLYIWK